MNESPVVKAENRDRGVCGTYLGRGISDRKFFNHVSVQYCSVTYRCTQGCIGQTSHPSDHIFPSGLLSPSGYLCTVYVPHTRANRKLGIDIAMLVTKKIVASFPFCFYFFVYSATQSH